MTRRAGAIKGLIGVAIATSITTALSVSASAQTSPWWPGDPEVILGYGCTSVELEPHDARFNCSYVHEGMDIDLPYGTPIYAGWSGVVTEIGGSEAHDYGPHAVKIWLDEGHDIVLGHLSKATVAKGQRVEIGTLVGYVGDLGVADIPNLDFNARPHGGGTHQSIDPSPFLAFLDRSLMSQSYAARGLNGRTQILVRSETDGGAWSSDLTGGWTKTAGGPHAGFLTDPVVAADGRGHLMAFGVGADGAVWVSSQLTALNATTRWTRWTSLGRPASVGSALVGLPATVLGPDGRMHVFVRAADATLWEAHQTRPGSHWSRWDRDPFASGLAGDPAVARDSRGAIQVVATSADGSVRVNRQAHAGGPWRGWHSLGKPAGQAVLGGRTTVLRDGAGLLEAFVLTEDGSVFAAIQSKGDRWLPWTQIGWRNDTSVAAVLRVDRRVQVFALNTSGALLTTIRQGHAWTPWTTLGHGLSGGLATVIGPGGSTLVLSGSEAGAFVMRAGDPQAFDNHSHAPLKEEFAEAQAQAWTSFTGLPRVRSAGYLRGVL